MSNRCAAMHWIWIPAMFVFFLLAPCPQADEAGQKLVEQTRQALRKDGFKIDLSEFDLSTTPESRAREITYNDALQVPAAKSVTGPRRMPRPPELLTYAGAPQSLAALNANHANLMEIVDSNSATVVWKMPTPIKDVRPGPGHLPVLTWDDYRRTFAVHGAGLDRAEAAIFAGPIRYDLTQNSNGLLVMPQSNSLLQVRQALEIRCLLALHDGDLPSAWTNLLAATRMVTAYEPGPPVARHLNAFHLTADAYALTWQALQTNGWTDTQLAALQSEWESLDFFDRLPETVAYTRAQNERYLHDRRTQPSEAPFGLFMAWAFRFPDMTWGLLNQYRSERLYFEHESYPDESKMLEHFRDDEIELQRAARAANWPEIRNLLRPSSHFPTRLMAIQNDILLGKAAGAETRRRIIIAALALERYRIRHGAYPATISALAPEFLKSPPIDFLDGQPLQYQVTGDGQFTFYSVGLDGGKNEGTAPQANLFSSYSSHSLEPSEKTPILWPLPATVAAVESARAAPPNQRWPKGRR